ncbi:MAG: hypothetical protein ACOWWR_06455 [Eubacteriales bacterium]
MMNKLTTGGGKIFAFVSIIVGLIYISCIVPPVDPPVNDWPEPVIIPPHEGSNLFPLKVGNSWTYEYSKWISEDIYDTVTFTREVILSKTVNSKKYFMFNRPLPFFLPLLNEGGIINYDSLYFRENEYGDIMLLVDSLEYPFLVYDRDNIDTTLILLMPGIEYLHKLLSITDTILTPIDTFFNCYNIFNADRTKSGSEHYIWFSPNEGPVKIRYPKIGIEYKLIDKIIND